MLLNNGSALKKITPGRVKALFIATLDFLFIMLRFNIYIFGPVINILFVVTFLITLQCLPVVCEVD